MKLSVADSNLVEIVKRLSAAIDPDRLVLFGSRARGDSRPDSDFDLLVIKDSSEKPHRRTIPAYRALSGLVVPTDILWRTPQEIDEWRNVPAHIATQAIREGRVVYERPR
jgi:predicted nucleotidyltransferase